MKRSRACSDLLSLESTASSSCMSYIERKRRRENVPNIRSYSEDSDDSVADLSEEFACGLWTNFVESGIVKQRSYSSRKSWIVDIDDSDERSELSLDGSAKSLLMDIAAGSIYSKLRRPSIEIHLTHPSHAIRRGSFEPPRTQY